MVTAGRDRRLIPETWEHERGPPNGEDAHTTLKEEGKLPNTITPTQPGTVRRSLVEIRASLAVNIRSAAESCIRAGLDLIEAKAQLKQGQWLPFLQDFGISHSTAANWMNVAREIGLDSPLAQLPYSKALALLAVPADERAQFAQENHVDEKSAAEIRRLIAERNKAMEAANAADNRCKELAREIEKAQYNAQCADQEREKIQAQLAQARQSARREIVYPEDYERLKQAAAANDRMTADAVMAAAEAEKRAQEAEDRLAALESAVDQRMPPDDLTALGAAVAAFITSTQMMLVNPAALAAREKETDALLRQLSRHVIQLQSAVSNAAFVGEGAVV